jgi:hypothetical protein
MMPKVTFVGYAFHAPNHPVIRMLLGIILVIFGCFGFLPILGFWMIPLGLVILSIDIPLIRRCRRRSTVRLGAWLKRHYPRIARHLGYSTSEGQALR